MAKSRLLRLLIGTEWRWAEGWQGEEAHPWPFSSGRDQCRRHFAFLPRGCKLWTWLGFICDSWENPGVMHLSTCSRASLRDERAESYPSYLTLNTCCDQSSVDGMASASRRGVAEWHFPNDRWTRPLMALPRMHLDVYLMPVEAEQRWAREQITQLTCAVHQSGYCRMLNSYFHLPLSRYDDFSMVTDYISTVAQLDQKQRQVSGYLASEALCINSLLSPLVSLW